MKTTLIYNSISGGLEKDYALINDELRKLANIEQQWNAKIEQRKADGYQAPKSQTKKKRIKYMGILEVSNWYSSNFALPHSWVTDITAAYEDLDEERTAIPTPTESKYYTTVEPKMRKPRDVEATREYQMALEYIDKCMRIGLLEFTSIGELKETIANLTMTLSTKDEDELNELAALYA